MGGYVFRRLIQGFLVLLGVSVVVFLMLHLAPGDPARLMLHDGASEEEIAHLRHLLGLDLPLHQQYFRFLFRALQGDLGNSLYYNQPAMGVVLEFFPATIGLASASLLITSLLITLLFAVPLGIVSALKRDSIIDYAGMSFAVLGQALPPFWFGIMMILIFGVKLGWFPTSGYGSLRHAVLPALTLGAYLMALLTRMVRSGLLEVLGEDYIRTARAKGLPERVVIWKHALRNAAIPLVTVVGLQLGSLLAGSLVTETVFAWPGVGRLLVQSIGARDYPVIQAAVLVISTVFVLLNILIDVLYVAIDPRISYS